MSNLVGTGGKGGLQKNTKSGWILLGASAFFACAGRRGENGGGAQKGERMHPRSPPKQCGGWSAVFYARRENGSVEVILHGIFKKGEKLVCRRRRDFRRGKESFIKEEKGSKPNILKYTNGARGNNHGGKMKGRSQKRREGS